MVILIVVAKFSSVWLCSIEKSPFSPIISPWCLCVKSCVLFLGGIFEEFQSFSMSCHATPIIPSRESLSSHHNINILLRLSLHVFCVAHDVCA